MTMKMKIEGNTASLNFGLDFKVNNESKGKYIVKFIVEAPEEIEKNDDPDAINLVLTQALMELSLSITQMQRFGGAPYCIEKFKT